MNTNVPKIKGWIKLADWKKVNYPTKCPYSGLKVDSSKEFIVYDTSILWNLLVILRVAQYITLTVPFHENGIRELRKRRVKAFFVGLGYGSIVAIIALVIGVYFAVEAESEIVERIGIMGGGIGFVASLIIGPLIMLRKEDNKTCPLYFKKKGKKLWVKIRNNDYRNQFILLNELSIIEDKSENSEILDD
jgi:hypothetical protein